jgi:hypothetical protein
LQLLLLDQLFEPGRDDAVQAWLHGGRSLCDQANRHKWLDQFCMWHGQNDRAARIIRWLAGSLHSAIPP